MNTTMHALIRGVDCCGCGCCCTRKPHSLAAAALAVEMMKADDEAVTDEIRQNTADAIDVEDVAGFVLSGELSEADAVLVSAFRRKYAS